ncbi:M23 family metallopeptidase [Leptolyngbya sp. 15MV]|nr:M23 family metallopeptidase [Leptolyngbya sp. 15MV]
MAPALLLARPAFAVEWRGTPAQGGLLVGRAAPGTRMTLDGRAVRVGASGDFALGFGRDHGPHATLSITHPGGRQDTRALAVARRQWDIQAINGLPPGLVTPDEAALRRITAERERLGAARAVDTALTDFTAPLAWPARGRISGVFGSQRVLNGQPRQPHYGLDVAGPVGTPVSAALAGRVTPSADFFFFGQLIVLDHGHGVNTLYAHLSERAVAEGETVAQGQPIGSMGATGRVTGPHLHFSLSWYQVWLDPQPLLPA